MKGTFNYFLSSYTQFLGEDNIQKSCVLLTELLKVKDVVAAVDIDMISTGYRQNWVHTFVEGYRKRYMNLLIDEIKDEDLPVFICYFIFDVTNSHKEYVRSILTYLWHRNAKIDPMQIVKYEKKPFIYTHILSPFSLHLLKIMSTLHRNLLFHHVTLEYLLKTMEVLTSVDLGLERSVLLQAIRDCCHVIAVTLVNYNEYEMI